MLFRSIINVEKGKLIDKKAFISSQPTFILSKRKQYMSHIVEEVKAYHPIKILNKGFAIPRYKGVLYRNQPLKPKEELEIELYNQTLVVSFIKSKKNG